MHSCNSTNPVLHIRNVECVATVYYDSPELTQEVCVSRDLSCTASRNELSDLHETLMEHMVMFEERANDTIADLYSFFLDGSDLFDFTENLDDLNE